MVIYIKRLTVIVELVFWFRNRIRHTVDIVNDLTVFFETEGLCPTRLNPLVAWFTFGCTVEATFITFDDSISPGSFTIQAALGWYPWLPFAIVTVVCVTLVLVLSLVKANIGRGIAVTADFTVNNF